MRTFQITIGTTPVNLFDLLTGTTFTNASIANNRQLSTPCAPLVRELAIQADPTNTNTVYGGATSEVASTDYGYRLTNGSEILFRDTIPNVPLTQWLVGGANGQVLHIRILW